MAVYTDDNGNIFLIDPNGNPQLGFYFVSHALWQMCQTSLCSSCTHHPDAIAVR